jgi:hypothetical protein
MKLVLRDGTKRKGPRGDFAYDGPTPPHERSPSMLYRIFLPHWSMPNPISPDEARPVRYKTDKNSTATWVGEFPSAPSNVQLSRRALAL